MGTLADLLFGVRDSLGMIVVLINIVGMINVVVVINMVGRVKIIATLAVVVTKIIIVCFLTGLHKSSTSQKLHEF